MKIQEVWKEWKVEKRIGRGSFGTVYKCCKEENGEQVYSAIKVISVPGDDVELQGNPSLERMSAEQSKAYYKEIIDGFMREIEILESLKGHPNIVRIDDSKVVETEDGIGWQLFIRMELLTDFNAYSCDRTFTEQDVIKLATDLASALKACARLNIVHRDIKPENIFVDEYGTFKLGDFGVAKQLERTETAMSRKGTFNYMAPEVLNAQKGDSRADIYSLGIVMYQLLNNNRFPFMDPNKQFITHSERDKAFKRRTVDGEKLPEIPNVSPEVNAIVLKATQFRKEDRFRSIDEFAAALDLLNGDKKKAAKVRHMGWSKGRKAGIAVVALLLVLGLGFGSFAAAFPDSFYETFPFLAKEFTEKQIEQLLEEDKKYTILNSGPIDGICTFDGVDFFVGCVETEEEQYNRLYKLKSNGSDLGTKEDLIQLSEDGQVCGKHFSIIKDMIYYSVLDAKTEKYRCYRVKINPKKNDKPEPLFEFNKTGGQVIYAMHEIRQSYSELKNYFKSESIEPLFGDENGEVFFFTDKNDNGKKALFCYTESTDSENKPEEIHFPVSEEDGTPAVADVAFAGRYLVFNLKGKKNGEGTATYRYETINKRGVLPQSDRQNQDPYVAEPVDFKVTYDENLGCQLMSTGKKCLAFIDSKGLCVWDPEEIKKTDNDNKWKNKSGAFLGFINEGLVGVKLLSTNKDNKPEAVGYRTFDVKNGILNESLLSKNYKTKFYSPACVLSDTSMYMLSGFSDLGQQTPENKAYELIKKEKKAQGKETVDKADKTENSDDQTIRFSNLIELSKEMDFDPKEGAPKQPVRLGKSIILEPNLQKKNNFTVHFIAENLKDGSWSDSSSNPLGTVLSSASGKYFVFDRSGTVNLRRSKNLSNHSDNIIAKLENGLPVSKLTDNKDEKYYVCECKDINGQTYRGWVYYSAVKEGTFGQYGQLSYSVENNNSTVTITGVINKDRLSSNLTLDIVNSLDLKITEISNGAFSDCTKLHEVTLKHVSSIGANAFKGCTNLRKINLSSVTSIGESAFENCVKLENVDLTSLSVVEESTFKKCSVLKTVVLPENKNFVIRENAFFGCANLTSLSPDYSCWENWDVADNAFEGCPKDYLAEYNEYNALLEEEETEYFEEEDSEPTTKKAKKAPKADATTEAEDLPAEEDATTASVDSDLETDDAA